MLKAEVTPLLLYKSQQDKACENWVEATLSRMSLKEKVGQLFIYTIAPVNNRKNLALLREVTHTYKVGALLFAGGALENQALLTNYAQKEAKIPLMITFDGEWGLAMRLKNTPDFPKNMVLGCIQDDRLIYRYGQEVARECKELGVDVNFAPVADVNINPNNPVINVRSFGENPNNVANKVIAYASGLESEGVLSVAKHFPGHGDTDTDSHLALPVLPFTRERLDSVELYPFKQAIRAGVSGIMVGHLQVPVLDHDNEFPSSLSRNIVYGLLREELRFKGLVFTDALAMKGVSKTENVCVRALKAGNDMVLTPRNIKEEMNSVMEALKSGTLTQESIENKCRKVLMYKYALGIQRKRTIRMSGLERRINTPEAEKLIRELRLAAVTVVENKKKVLPLHQDKSALAVVSIGDTKADSAFIRGLEKYAVIDHYHLTEELSDSARQVLKQTLAMHKRVVVSITTTNVRAFDSFLAELSTAVSTIYTFFTPVAVMDKLKMPLSLASAVVLSHSGETEVLAHTANALFGKVSVDGRLSVSVQGLYKENDGVTITPNTPHYYDPEEYGMHAEVLSRIDSIVYEGIAKGAFPGCQVVILKDGKPVYDRCFGTLTYEDKNRKVKSTDLYDLASLSKTTGTLLAVMKLYDQGRFSLTDKVSQYLPFLRGTNKENITISELLFHQSGLPPSLPFYREALDPTSYKGKKLTCSSLKYKDGM
ncbi:MAG: glycoside hydrolase family 3 N-terminal domain-containing protein, partial [Bacteroidaceae bacterium]